MAAAINFCCQGRPFFLAGEEFGRTKGGVKNSYCSHSRINQLDWVRAWKNKDLVDYYRGFIALRQQLPAVLDKTADAGKRILWAKQTAPDCAAVCLDNRGDSPWKQVLLLVNGSKDDRMGSLPEGSWQVLADGTSSFRWQENILADKLFRSKAGTVTVLGMV